ncbi:regulator of chromosome condensation 1/beta-lactamase-inhibitor protein II [Pilaira anomala]|nr:regulator of chromosome condensation 1/beta-lactamase-inhibitor protein II [Pilaira anomala]
MSFQLYSFGFNAFNQISGDNSSHLTVAKTCHKHVDKVLFTSWETTIVLDDSNQLVVWGFQPTWFDKIIELKKQIQFIFGDPNQLLGIIDQHQFVSILGAQTRLVDFCKADNVVYCSQLNSLFILYQGTVSRYDLDTQKRETLFDNHHIKSISGSDTHILFSTDSFSAPLYGMGSNRLSQLGIDYQQQQVTEPQIIDYFCGLGVVTDMACGPFHSAVILSGDVYTFGWSKEGRLGSGTEPTEEIISLGIFLDEKDRPVEINAVKVVCGSSHTLVMDDTGRVWSCGSNGYGQLGREELMDHYFRTCFDSRAISIYAGKWTSFIVQN